AVIGAPSNSGRVLLSAQSLVDLYLKGGGSSPALKSTTTLTSDDMRIDIIGAKSILIYVHGYNSSFEDAAFRSLELRQGIHFDGLLLLFSWPSAATSAGYLLDAEFALLSEGAFEDLISYLTQMPIATVHIVAVGMGARIAAQVIKSLVERGR